VSEQDEHSLFFGRRLHYVIFYALNPDAVYNRYELYFHA